MKSLSEMLVTLLLVIRLINYNRASIISENVEIICSKLENFHWYIVGEMMTCVTGKNTKIQTRNSLIDELSKNPGVEAVYFKNSSQVEFIPKNLKKTFPKLKGLYLSKQPIKILDAEDLRQFGYDLEWLQVFEGKITHLNRNLFVYNMNLKVVSFARNPLKFIESGFFDNVIRMENWKLEFIDFQGCGCISQYKTKDNFHYTPWTHSCTENKLAYKIGSREN